jgi:hypothetical protein
MVISLLWNGSGKKKKSGSVVESLFEEFAGCV